MKVVSTKMGLIPRDQLQVAVLLAEDEEQLSVVTTWRLLSIDSEGQLVKLDAHLVETFQRDEAGQKMAMTNRGLMRRDELQIHLELHESENALVVVTTWRVKNEGPEAVHVRRDANGLMLATPETQLQFGNFVGRMILAKPPERAPGDVTIGLQGQQIGTEQAQLG